MKSASHGQGWWFPASISAYVIWLSQAWICGKLKSNVRRRCKEENFLPLQIAWMWCCHVILPMPLVASQRRSSSRFSTSLHLWKMAICSRSTWYWGSDCQIRPQCIKLNFNNVRTTEKIHPKLYWWFSWPMLGLCGWYTVWRSGKTLWT